MPGSRREHIDIAAAARTRPSGCGITPALTSEDCGAPSARTLETTASAALRPSAAKSSRLAADQSCSMRKARCRWPRSWASVNHSGRTMSTRSCLSGPRHAGRSPTSEIRPSTTSRQAPPARAGHRSNPRAEPSVGTPQRRGSNQTRDTHDDLVSPPSSRQQLASEPHAWASVPSR